MAWAPVASAAVRTWSILRYDSADDAAPMHRASSAIVTCAARASASEKTATHLTPRRWAVRMMRQAISPRFDTRIFPNMPGATATLRELRDAQGVLGRRTGLGALMGCCDGFGQLLVNHTHG